MCSDVIAHSWSSDPQISADVSRWTVETNIVFLRILAGCVIGVTHVTSFEFCADRLRRNGCIPWRSDVCIIFCTNALGLLSEAYFACRNIRRSTTVQVRLMVTVVVDTSFQCLGCRSYLSQFSTPLSQSFSFSSCSLYGALPHLHLEVLHTTGTIQTTAAPLSRVPSRYGTKTNWIVSGSSGMFWAGWRLDLGSEVCRLLNLQFTG